MCPLICSFPLLFACVAVGLWSGQLFLLRNSVDEVQGDYGKQQPGGENERMGHIRQIVGDNSVFLHIATNAASK